MCYPAARELIRGRCREPPWPPVVAHNGVDLYVLVELQALQEHRRYPSILE
jgi:hypothetical protein